jgi:glyoxylase I family protein
MELLGVHHISINVADHEAAERFYVDVLGFSRLPRPDFGFAGSWLGMPDGRQVHLIEVADWVAPKGQHFAFHVADLDGVRDELLGRGIKVSEVNELTGVGRQCFFKDPCGNLLELNEPVASRRRRETVAAASV